MPPATPPDAPAISAFLPPSFPPTTPAQMAQARRMAQEAQAARQLARQTLPPGSVWITVRMIGYEVVRTEEPL